MSTNMQLKAAGFFKCGRPFSGHLTLKGYLLVVTDAQ